MKKEVYYQCKDIQGRIFRLVEAPSREFDWYELTKDRWGTQFYWFIMRADLPKDMKLTKKRFVSSKEYVAGAPISPRLVPRNTRGKA
jgi:hypothetical protein